MTKLLTSCAKRTINSRANIRAPPRCIECNSAVAGRHFLQRRRTCQHCGYSTRCKKASARHRLLSMCNAGNSVRWPLGMPPTTSTTNGIPPQKLQLLSCIACKFRTRNAAQMFSHLQGRDCREHGEGRIMCRVEQQKTVDEEPAAEDEELQIQEAATFGLMTLADVEVDSEADSTSIPKGRETEFETLTEILRPQQALEALDKPSFIKHLFNDDSTANNKQSSAGDVATWFNMALFCTERQRKEAATQWIGTRKKQQITTRNGPQKPVLANNDEKKTLMRDLL